MSTKYDSDSQGSQDSALLHDALYPADAYDSDGTYWADLPLGRQLSFVNKQYRSEVWRELKVVGRMTKEDPLSPVGAYLSRYVTTGAGMFAEGYVLFSIGNLSSLFKQVWPDCYGSPGPVCNKIWRNSVDYLEICGIIVGMLCVGIEGDWIGRKFGLVQDAVVMLIGCLLLTAVWGTSINGWVIGYAWSLFIYGFGVGGEYPMTSTRALESRARGPAGSTDDRLHRGRNVVLAFLMQGWGQVFNVAILMLCLLIFHGGSISAPYSQTLGQFVYRVSFGIIAVVHLWLIYYRVYKVKDADKSMKISRAKHHTTGYDVKSLKLLMNHYWARLLATAGTWFMNDFFFYGNKIFQGVFISIIHPEANSNVMIAWEYALLNCAVSLAGYYSAAFMIDHKMYGRKLMTQIGFLMDFLFFLFGAIFFKQLQEPGAKVKVFMWMYFMSSYFNQFGPNCTTFLLAAEVYPSSIRATAHGFSAAVGKLGALAPTILYNYIDNQTKFWVVPWFGLAGFLLTFLFMPDTTGLDLRELERYWTYVSSGREDEYHGVAIHPTHLSWYERVVLKRHRFYNPELDHAAKIDELRILYEATLIGDEKGEPVDDAAFISPEIARYFDGESDIKDRIRKQSKKERILHNQAEDKIHPSTLKSEL